MKPKNLKRLSLTWLIVLAALFGALAVSYYLLQSKPNTGSNRDNQEISLAEESNEAEEQESTGTIITSGNSDFGTMLFNNVGQAIYIWELEESSTAECYSDCAKAWPPVLTTGEPRTMGDVNNKLLGTTKRTDGSTQVTYNGHPLYYYAHEKAGEVKCHNVSTHGGLWWVIQPSGNRAK